MGRRPLLIALAVLVVTFAVGAALWFNEERVHAGLFLVQGICLAVVAIVLPSSIPGSLKSYGRRVLSHGRIEFTLMAVVLLALAALILWSNAKAR